MNINKNITKYYIMISLKSISVFSLRAIILGTIVFSSVSHIPKTAISMRNRFIISLVVVILFALIDHLKNFFTTIRKYLCKVVCDCDPTTDSSDDVLDDLDE